MEQEKEIQFITPAVIRKPGRDDQPFTVVWSLSPRYSESTGRSGEWESVDGKYKEN